MPSLADAPSPAKSDSNRRAVAAHAIYGKPGRGAFSLRKRRLSSSRNKTCRGRNGGHERFTLGPVNTIRSLFRGKNQGHKATPPPEANGASVAYLSYILKLFVKFLSTNPRGASGRCGNMDRPRRPSLLSLGRPARRRTTFRPASRFHLLKIKRAGEGLGGVGGRGGPPARGGGLPFPPQSHAARLPRPSLDRPGGHT